MSNSEATSPFLPLPDGIFISSVHTTTTELVVHIASRQVSAACPLCQQPSERVHGHYGRTVADLPCGGRRVILALTVRKFVCAKACCPQKIFTERLAELVQSYARMTNRLRDATSRTRSGHQCPGERAISAFTRDARFGPYPSSSSARGGLPASQVGTYSWCG